MTSEQALDVARTATSIATATPDPEDPVGRKPGQTVTVTPDDTGRDPVIGELVASGVHEIVIRRSDPRSARSACIFHAPASWSHRPSARPALARPVSARSGLPASPAAASSGVQF